MELIKHGTGGAYCYYRGCTIYLDYRDESTGYPTGRLAVDSNLTATHFFLYLLLGEIQISDSDKFMLADRDTFDPYIVRANGDVVNFSQTEQVHLNSYYFNNEKNVLWIQRIVNKLKESGCNDEECALGFIQNRVDDYLNRDIWYYGTKLSLTTFFGDECLWIDQNPDSRCLPHMEFVGGYPNEWCVFISKLTDSDFEHIKLWNGESVTKEMLIQMANK